MATLEKKHKLKGVWSPYVLATIAILLSGYPALILFAINFGRYGLPRKRTFWLIATPIIYFLFYAIDRISPDWMTQRGTLFNFTVIWITYSHQIGFHQQWKLDRKPKAPIWLAVLISLGVLSLLGGIHFLIWDLLP